MASIASSVKQVRFGANPPFEQAVEWNLQAPSAGADAGLADFQTTIRHLFAKATPDDTAAQVTALAGLRYDADAAGVILLKRDGTLSQLGRHHPAASRVDALQVSGHEGPALQAIARRQPVIVSDLRSDNRWRSWAPLAADEGFRSVLSVPLDGDVVGALTLYSTCRSQFQPNLLQSAGVFARLASIAVAMAQERQQLMEAAASHAVVGQAQGILMERYGITADGAFAVLRRYSSHLNRKLRLIAEGLIQDCGLSEHPRPGPAQPTSTLRLS
jgi:GAF domain-containing protein